MPHVALHPVAQRSSGMNTVELTPTASSDSGMDHQLKSTPLLKTPYFPAFDKLLSTQSGAVAGVDASTSLRPRLLTGSSRPSYSSRSPSSTQRSAAANRSGSPAAAAAASPGLRPSHGLIHFDAQVLPLCSSSTKPIRLITAAQYVDLQREYLSLSEPKERILFPWSHENADVPGSSAAHYFGFGKEDAAPVPSFRGLTTLHAPAEPTIVRRSRTASPGSSGSSSSESSIPATPAHADAQASKFSDPRSILTSSFPLATVIKELPAGTATSRYCFNIPQKPLGATVSLRKFDIQAAKYASICDIVVYGATGVTEQIVKAAEAIHEAQELTWRQRGSTGVKYNVLIISDPFTIFEEDFPHLVAVDSDGFTRNKLDFLTREREEMRVLTQASQIAPNIFLGNTMDLEQVSTSDEHPESLNHCQGQHQVRVHERSRSSDSDSDAEHADDRSSTGAAQSSSSGASTFSLSPAKYDNPLGISIAVEMREGATIPKEANFPTYDYVMRENEQCRLKEAIQSSSFKSASFSSSRSESNIQVGQPGRCEILQLECLAWGADAIPIRLGPTKRSDPMLSPSLFANKLVSFAMWLVAQSLPGSDGRSPRPVLLHCQDGYTETSLLALAIVMYTRACSAPDAYLIMQLELERSFYVHPTERGLVALLEKRLGDMLRREQTEKEQEALATTRALSCKFEPTQSLPTVSFDSSPSNETVLRDVSNSWGDGRAAGMERSDSGFDEGDCEIDGVALKKDVRLVKARISRRTFEPASPTTHPWYFAETFEGHFPSRILPYIYLGNLKHAMNASMLKALGITHVVSMGESALTPPKAPSSFSSFLPSSLAINSNCDGNCNGDNSLWLAQRRGEITVLDLQGIADDGIDSLRPYLTQSLNFIEQAKREGGRVLVHCKVGVSRSASVVIAYLIKWVGLDLASAYLLTRARRLNILIQPNLPFSATLHSFEGDVLKFKDSVRGKGGDEFRAETEEDNSDDPLEELGRAGLKRSNRLHWSVFAHEIAMLNGRFDC